MRDRAAEPSPRALRGAAFRLLGMVLCVFGLGSDCTWMQRAAEKSIILTSLLKFPITYRFSELNTPLSKSEIACLKTPTCVTPAPATPANPLVEVEPDPLRDDFSDLLLDDGSHDVPGTQDPVVFVAISGGGARAARFAALTLAAIEDAYDPAACSNAAMTEGAYAPQPLIERIRAFSSVSGGSLYASRIAATMRRQFDWESSRPETRSLRRCFFRYAAGWPSAKIVDQRLGLLASVAYVNPLAAINPWPLARVVLEMNPFPLLDFLYYPPLLGLFTNRDFIDDLAYGLDSSYCGASGWLFGPACAPSARRRFQLGDFQAPQFPRFLFNATALETGRPFILTQRVSWPVTIEDGVIQSGAVRDEHVGTLEAIGSSPTNFPLSYAAMASAAFPVATQPIELRKNRIDGDAATKTMDVVHLVDGGAYDNSGLVVLEMFVRRAHRVAALEGRALRPIVVIAISAEAAGPASDYMERPGRTPAGMDTIAMAVDVGIPVAAALAPAGRTIGILSDTTWRESDAERALGAGGHTVETVRLRDLHRLHSPTAGRSVSARSASTEFDCSQGEALEAKTNKIATDYIISNPDDDLLREAVQLLLACGHPGAGAGSGSGTTSLGVEIDRVLHPLPTHE